MNSVLHKFLRSHVLVFFDDILVYSPTWETHLHHLNLVLKELQNNHLRVKLSKCTFGVTSIQYLGHYVTGKGVSVDPEKISAISSWPTPTTVRQLRGFLGLTGYYRRFIRGYAHIASPLTSLLCKGAFQWGEQAHHAFAHLKRALSTAPVLALPDFHSTFYIDTDASGVAMGAVLIQHGHPLSYFSKTFPP